MGVGSTIKKLAQFGQLRRMERGGIIFREGEWGQEMFIILSGSVEITVERDGKQVTIARLGQGDFFGEMAVLEGEPRSGTAVALEPSLIVALNQDNFRQLLKEDGELAWRMMKVLSARIRALNRELALRLTQQETMGELTLNSNGDNGMGPNGVTLDALLSSGNGRPKESFAAAAEAALEEGGPFGGSGTEDTGEGAERTEEKEAGLFAQAPGYLEQAIDDREFADKLFDREVVCPVCEKRFTVKSIRSTKLVRVKHETDFRQRYEKFEPLWYIVWVCPNCFYANYRSEFSTLAGAQKKLLEAGREKRKKEFYPEFGSRRTVRGVIEAYRLAVECAVTMRDREEKIGNLWLNLAWIYEDFGDTHRQREALEQALYWMKKGFLETSHHLSLEQVQKVGYLIGEICRRLGLYREAREFYYRSIQRKGGNKAINVLATDQLQAIKEYLKEQQDGLQELKTE